jgi:hypothetical protein
MERSQSCIILLSRIRRFTPYLLYTVDLINTEVYLLKVGKLIIEATLTSTRQRAALGRAAARPGVLEDVEAAAARAAGPSEAATFRAATKLIFTFRDWSLQTSSFHLSTSRKLVAL